MPPLILLVGHCLPDSFALKRTVHRALPDAKAKRITSTGALDEHLPGASLLLINRVLEGRFDTDSGIDLIRALNEQPSGAPRPILMLVSNYDDAQAAATAAGAHPGFGKHDLRTTAPDRIRQALAPAR
jgi:hypothetical protein